MTKDRADLIADAVMDAIERRQGILRDDIIEAARKVLAVEASSGKDGLELRDSFYSAYSWTSASPVITGGTSHRTYALRGNLVVTEAINWVEGYYLAPFVHDPTFPEGLVCYHDSEREPRYRLVSKRAHTPIHREEAEKMRMERIRELTEPTPFIPADAFDAAAIIPGDVSDELMEWAEGVFDVDRASKEDHTAYILTHGSKIYPLPESKLSPFYNARQELREALYDNLFLSLKDETNGPA